jgi:hypothetical protein
VKDGELVGIISRTDLVRAFVRSDEQIARRSETTCCGARCGSKVPEAVQVHVERGAVRLSGQVETSTDAILLQRLVARVRESSRCTPSSAGSSTTTSERAASSSVSS